MTVPAALPVPLPGAALTPASATPPGAEPGEPALGTDAFAALLAALAGGVAVPVPGIPLPPPQVVTEDPSGAAAAPTVTAAYPAPQDISASPLTWEAMAQRTHVPAPETVVAPAGTVAPEAPAAALTTEVRRTAGLPDPVSPQASVAAPTAAAPAAAAPAPATVGAATADPAQPAPAEVLPAEAVAAAGAVLSAAPAAAQAAAAPEAHAATSTRHVQPAVVEAARGLRDEGGGRTSLVVRLDPPELGAVVVRLTVQDGRVDVQLRTPDVTARGDLQAQSFDVQRVLRDNGFDLTSFDVSHGDLPGGAQEDAKTPDRGTSQRQVPADGHAGNSRVTDDVTDPQPAGTWL